MVPDTPQPPVPDPARPRPRRVKNPEVGPTTPRGPDLVRAALSVRAPLLRHSAALRLPRRRSSLPATAGPRSSGPSSPRSSPWRRRRRRLQPRVLSLPAARRRRRWPRERRRERPCGLCEGVSGSGRSRRARGVSEVAGLPPLRRARRARRGSSQAPRLRSAWDAPSWRLSLPWDPVFVTCLGKGHRQLVVIKCHGN